MKHAIYYEKKREEVQKSILNNLIKNYATFFFGIKNYATLIPFFSGNHRK
jgi:hypothetical protein